MNLNLEPWLLLPLALVLFLMAMPVLSRRFKGKVEYITTDQLNNILARGEPVVVIDIRPEKDFAQGHIEGAVNISPATLKKKIEDEEQDFTRLKDQAIVVVCRSDLDSIGAARSLEKSGFMDVSVLKGGVFRWKRDHRPLAKV